jgi:hypothetical protein
MTMLNLSQVSKQFKVNRSTIYRAVSSGRLSRRADGSFDLAEVIRCFGDPVAAQQPKQQSNPIEQNQDQTKIIELLQRELQQYRDREERLLNQIDRMQTLIEMKSPVVADATSQQQMHATQSDTTQATPETIAETVHATDETPHAAMQQQVSASQRNTADATQQRPQKKRGLLGRLVQAVFDDE